MGRGQGSGGRAGRPLNSGGSVRKGVAPGSALGAGGIDAEAQAAALVQPESYREFVGDSESTDWAYANYDFTTVPYSEMSAIVSYTGNSYIGLNKGLREGTPLSEKNEAMLFNMDNFFKSSTARSASNITVWRGAGKEAGSKIMALGVGGVFHDQGFVSTSLVRSSAFTSYEYHFKINVKKGQRGAAVLQVSYHKNENEFLLPRGSSFQIKNIEKKGGKTFVEMDYLG